MANNAAGKNAINHIHHYLNLQENVAEKIDRHTRNLQKATKAYAKTEKKLKQFGKTNINYFGLSKALFLLIVSFYIAYRFVFTPRFSIVVAVIGIVGVIAGTYAAHSYMQQSTKNYKRILETEALQHKNTIEQLKKNIDNRIRELHEIQQALQKLWTQNMGNG